MWIGGRYEVQLISSIEISSPGCHTSWGLGMVKVNNTRVSLGLYTSQKRLGFAVVMETPKSYRLIISEFCLLVCFCCCCFLGFFLFFCFFFCSRKSASGWLWLCHIIFTLRPRRQSSLYLGQCYLSWERKKLIKDFPKATLSWILKIALDLAIHYKDSQVWRHMVTECWFTTEKGSEATSAKEKVHGIKSGGNRCKSPKVPSQWSHTESI